MEITVPFRSNWSRRRRGYYNRMSPPNKRSLRVEKLGRAKRPWRLRLGRKLRLIKLASPVRLWWKLKNAYMNMVSGWGYNSGSNVFGSKRIPKARDDRPMAGSRMEFENRLVFEIYKSMVSSYELGYTSKLS